MKSYQTNQLAKQILKPVLYGALALSIGYSCKNQEAKNNDCPESCTNIYNGNVTITHNHYNQQKVEAKKPRKNKSSKVSKTTPKKINSSHQNTVSIDTMVQTQPVPKSINMDYEYGNTGGQNSGAYKLNDCDLKRFN